MMQLSDYAVFCSTCGSQITARCEACLTPRCACLARCIGCGDITEAGHAAAGETTGASRVTKRVDD